MSIHVYIHMSVHMSIHVYIYMYVHVCTLVLCSCLVHMSNHKFQHMSNHKFQHMSTTCLLHKVMDLGGPDDLFCPPIVETTAASSPLPCSELCEQYVDTENYIADAGPVGHPFLAGPTPSTDSLMG